MITSVSPVTSGRAATERTATDTLGKDDFLRLLITQLRYQDPLSPMEDKEFIAQMAQFSSLEQMRNLYKLNQLQQATSLLGRSVLAAKETDGLPEQVYGRVTGVRTFGDNVLLLLDNGTEVKADEVISVMDEQGLNQYLQGLVGSRAWVRVYNDAGEVIDLRQVFVDSYEIINGVGYIISGEERIPLADVWAVG
ncbi:MAG: flagellar hook assembly protein FlgD [Firmicutes bacterium]|jgi:flagellar basal-body rod modification protein FlgD|nr:flagellar hook assembly protein FlgD [Bacillota bacterium]